MKATMAKRKILEISFFLSLSLSLFFSPVSVGCRDKADLHAPVAAWTLELILSLTRARSPFSALPVLFAAAGFGFGAALFGATRPKDRSRACATIKMQSVFLTSQKIERI